MKPQGDITFTGGLSDAISFLDKKGAETLEQMRIFRHNVKELTGHDPDKPVTALDVVKIVKHVFYRDTEANGDIPQATE